MLIKYLTLSIEVKVFYMIICLELQFVKILLSNILDYYPAFLRFIHDQVHVNAIQITEMG